MTQHWDEDPPTDLTGLDQDHHTAFIDQTMGWPSDPRSLGWRLLEMLANNLVLMCMFGALVAITVLVSE